MNWNHHLDGEILIELGNYLKQLRVNANLNQKEVAHKIGVSRTSIWSIEKGENSSLLIFIKLLKLYNRINKLEEILQVTNISPKDLFKENK